MASPFDYAYRGNNWDAWKGTLQRADLEGLDVNVLSNEQHDMVAAYMAATGKALDRGATLNSSNYGRDYWMSLYNEAQGWWRDRESEFASGKAQMEREAADRKSRALAEYTAQMEREYGATEEARRADFTNAINSQASQYEAALSSFQQQQQSAAEAQRQAEAQRAAQEWQNTLSQFRTAQQGLGTQGLTTDADQFQGELGQFGTYWQEVADQLSDAGYDVNSILGDYQSTINQYAQGATGAQSAYEGLLGNITSISPEELATQYGNTQNLSAYATNQRDLYQSQYDQYSQQINQLLGNLGSIYSAYNRIGDLDAAVGNTTQEKLGYLTGLGTQPVFDSIDSYYQGFQQEYMDYANRLASLYKTDNPNQYENLLGEYTDKSTGFLSQLEGAKGGYLDQYNNATNQLLSLFGDVNAVQSGLFSNTATNLQGQLSTSANSLSSLLGSQENELLDLQDLYNSTVSQLTSQRLGEKQSLLSQRTQNRANRQRNQALSTSKLGESQARTQGLSSLFEDNLGLTRGYSLLSQ